MKRFEVDGVEYGIIDVSADILSEATIVYNKAFNTAIKNGAMVRKVLSQHLRQQGLWGDDKEEELKLLCKDIAAIEYKIKSGQVKKASEMKELALQLKEKRAGVFSTNQLLSEYDSITAEGIADNEKFNYIASRCIVDYTTQCPLFSSLSDFTAKANDTKYLTVIVKFAEHYYNLDNSFANSLLENRVLKKLHVVDDSLNFINKEGKRVDKDGNLVDENGNRIDAEGNRIDINNNPLIDDSVIDELDIEYDL